MLLIRRRRAAVIHRAYDSMIDTRISRSRGQKGRALPTSPTRASSWSNSDSVSEQSWDWLVDLSLRLNIASEIIDAKAVPVLPVGSAHDSAFFRRLLASGEPSLRSAMGDALRAKTQVAVSVEQMQVLCCGLASGGVLLLARTPTPRESPEDCQADLRSIATWLAGVVESGLTEPDTVNVEAYRLISLRRIMAEAASRSSIRRVIGAFVEALSVWDDIRVRCYVEGANGGFFQYGSALSAIPSSFPDRLEDDQVFQQGRVVRVSRADAQRLRVTPDPADTLVCRVVVDDVAWVIFFSGMVDDREEIRLRVYADILRESLNEVVSAVASRLVAEVSRSAPSGEPVASLAEVALGQLTSSVGGLHGAMVITVATGRDSIAVGHRDLLASAEQARRNRLFVRSSTVGSIMTVAIEREQWPFTAFERELVRAGVAVVHRWVQAALQQSPERVERRSGFRPLEATFDQFAQDAVKAGRPASVIVVSVDPARLVPGSLPTWVGRIRADIRAGDLAGVLSDREVGILLAGASADHASAVSARLMQMLAAHDDTGVVRHSAVGITTRSPESPADGSLVGAARATASPYR